MDRLIKGIREFRESSFKKDEAFFKSLSTGQSPDTLLVVCSDSRVDPNLFTSSRPGELFIVKNIGNIVPPDGARIEINSTIAAVEFALLVLKVSNIVVCGHSDCGAMQAVTAGQESLSDKPYLKKWIGLASDVKRRVDRKYPGASDRERKALTEKENVVAQMENLLTHGFVEKAVEGGGVRLLGWYYEVGNGRVHQYEPATGAFAAVE